MEMNDTVALVLTDDEGKALAHITITPINTYRAHIPTASIARDIVRLINKSTNNLHATVDMKKVRSRDVITQPEGTYADAIILNRDGQDVVRIPLDQAFSPVGTPIDRVAKGIAQAITDSTELYVFNARVSYAKGERPILEESRFMSDRDVKLETCTLKSKLRVEVDDLRKELGSMKKTFKGEIKSIKTGNKNRAGVFKDNMASEVRKLVDMVSTVAARLDEVMLKNLNIEREITSDKKHPGHGENSSFKLIGRTNIESIDANQLRVGRFGFDNVVVDFHDENGVTYNKAGYGMDSCRIQTDADLFLARYPFILINPTFEPVTNGNSGEMFFSGYSTDYYEPEVGQVWIDIKRNVMPIIVTDVNPPGCIPETVEFRHGDFLCGRKMSFKRFNECFRYTLTHVDQRIRTL